MVASLVQSYGTYIRLRLTRPSASDYDQAATYVRERFQPGDLIDTHPFWATRAREYLGDLELASLRHPESEDLTRYRRIWLFSPFGAEERSGAVRAMVDKGSLLDERRFGRIDVRLYALRGHQPVAYDFRARIESARVWIQTGNERQECGVWDHGRWRCSPTAAWNYVGREILEIGGEPRAVIWAHPVSRGTLTIDFPSVPFGKAMTFAAGLTPEALRFGGAPVELTVEAEGRPLLTRTYGPGSSFATGRIDTRTLSGTVGRVRFEVTTTDDRLRHFCFSAEIRG